MNVESTKLAGSIGLIALVAAGCSANASHPGESPALEALKAEYTSATGSFTLAQIPTVIAALNAGEQIPTGLPLQFMPGIDGGVVWSPDCLTGRVSEQAPDSATGAVTLLYDACTLEGIALPGEVNDSVSGSLSVVYVPTNPGADAVYSGTLSVTEQAVTADAASTFQLDASFATIFGTAGYTFVVPLESGTVVVSPETSAWTFQGGSFSVIDRNGTWLCSYDSQFLDGECVFAGDDGGFQSMMWKLTDAGAEPWTPSDGGAGGD